MNEALAIVEREMTPTPAVLFRDSEPAGIVRQATAIADELKKVIRDQKLYTNIKGREHVRVEGWCLLGTMLGVFPVPVRVEPLADGRGYMAQVEARTMGGAVVGSAFAICTRDEDNWKTRDEFALMSMAQTRATGKAMRLPLGFVMTLAGYESTPAEEMEVAREPMRVTAPQRPQPKPQGRAPVDATAVAMITDEQKAEIKAVSEERLMISWADVVSLCREHYKKGPAALTAAEADAFIAVLNDQAGVAADDAVDADGYSAMDPNR